MMTREQLSQKVLSIADELKECSAKEVLQIVFCLNMSAVAAVVQDRDFYDVVENGMVKEQ